MSSFYLNAKIELESKDDLHNILCFYRCKFFYSQDLEVYNIYIYFLLIIIYKGIK